MNIDDTVTDKGDATEFDGLKCRVADLMRTLKVSAFGWTGMQGMLARTSLPPRRSALLGSAE